MAQIEQSLRDRIVVQCFEILGNSQDLTDAPIDVIENCRQREECLIADMIRFPLTIKPEAKQALEFDRVTEAFLPISRDKATFLREAELIRQSCLQEKWIDLIVTRLNGYHSAVNEKLQDYLDQSSNDSEPISVEELASSFLRYTLDHLKAVDSDWSRVVNEASSSLLKSTSRQAKPKQLLEKALEEELYLWLLSNKVPVERQVSTVRHRLDLWIPNTCFLELKAGRISSDDFCQALDYYSTYRKTVVLIGKTIGSGASRGMEAASDLIGSDAIVFVSWGAARDYLSRLVGF